MNIKHIFITALVAAIVGSVTASGAFTNAAQPPNNNQPRVYKLYDANNTYLGDVIGVTSADNSNSVHDYAPSYTTLLPNTGTVQQLYGYYYGAVSLANIPNYVYYTSTDCTGTPYLEANGNTNYFTAPWVIRYNHMPYTISSSSSIQLVQSQSNGDGDFCQGANQNLLSYTLTPAVLPFDINAIVAPFSIK